MNSVDQFLLTARDRGLRITPQRLCIYEALEGDTGHPTAEEVFLRVRSTLPTISLTTVYRTLHELVRLGRVKQFDVNGVTRFDPNTEPHAEAVCLNCGSIRDIHDENPIPTAKPEGFVVTSSATVVYGYCSDCSASTPRTSNND